MHWPTEACKAQVTDLQPLLSGAGLLFAALGRHAARATPSRIAGVVNIIERMWPSPASEWYNVGCVTAVFRTSSGEPDLG